MHVDSSPLLSHPPLSSSTPVPARPLLAQLAHQQDVPVVPQILCNRNGPSKWKMCVYQIIKNDISLLWSVPPNSVKSLLSLASLWGAAVLIAHIARSIFCIEMPFPWYFLRSHDSEEDHVVAICSTFYAVAGMLDVALYIFFFLIFDFFCIRLFFAIEPTNENYKNYILSIIQPLLNENQLGLAYKKLFASDEYKQSGGLAEINEEILSELCKIFVEKLLNMNFFNTVILDRLMLSAWWRDYSLKTLDCCFTMRVKKMHETNQDPKSILTIISGIQNEQEKSQLIRECAEMHLEKANKWISDVIVRNTHLTKELTALVLNYIGTSLELARTSLNLPLQTPPQADGNELQRLTDSLITIVNGLAPQRVKDLRDLAQFPRSDDSCLSGFSEKIISLPKIDLEVLSALHNLDPVP